ncbi:ribosomal protein S16 [Nesidiocoris tenuis]|uniref:Small ribosomal subunit protein bS16m n=1 Tax=Nesidiocoris tenuis TaxID=355587 RepID=A0ABN7BAF9_9HEMI|nr:ribosomal protein S16 [Nesidiocoris tenuis]
MPFKFPVIFNHAGGNFAFKYAEKGIRLARYGCTNRPFYHIVVNHLRRGEREQPIEQLGSFDPMANHKQERLVAINVERLQYWIGEGAVISKPCAELLGLSGLLPIHPFSYQKAWRRRREDFENANRPVEESSDVKTSDASN